MHHVRLDAAERASRHAIVHNRPVVDFFAGALLGNGGLGTVVTTRPDAVAIHFGHNDVWDIRLSEKNAGKIGTFKEIFNHVMSIPSAGGRIDADPWYTEYCALMSESYNRPYPRPFPCGTLIVGFDRRRIELLGHTLAIDNGLCTVDLLVEGRPAVIEVFVDQTVDRLWLRFRSERGGPKGFDSVRLLPDPDGLAGGPSLSCPTPQVPTDMPGDVLCFRQVLPFRLPDDSGAGPDARDRAFRISARISAPLERRSRPSWYGVSDPMPPLEGAIDQNAPLLLCVQLDSGLAADIPCAPANMPVADVTSWEAAWGAARGAWAAFWERSAVALDDEQLEQVWYRNLYFFKCAVRPGVTCPGLWANWSYRDIGTAWHGDYHMNYNAQQPFWGAFSSNHVELHLPYVDLVDKLLPVSRKWARDYYGLRGAAFPHSAFPVEMNDNPYPLPTWGWEICETPWTVQSLWWHYLYTQDRVFLADRAFGPIREVVEFLVDYLHRPEADGKRWGDNRLHVFPTVSPELYGLTPQLRMNRDCLLDLTLIRFLFRAFREACSVLDREAEENELSGAVRDALDRLAPLPTAEGTAGRVFVSVPGEDPEIIYNVPLPGMTVFPGEQHGLDSPAEEYELSARSYRQQQLEGGNELVFAALQGARLGLLDLERWKRQIAYCTLPNGTCTDNALQVHGRYGDSTPYDFMARMGVWFENFALPAVIDECLLQGYNGTLRFFPNWPREHDAEFRGLRTAGAFLVSAALVHGEVSWVEIESEAGAPLRVMLPWQDGARVEHHETERVVSGGVLELATRPGEIVRLLPPAGKG